MMKKIIFIAFIFLSVAAQSQVTRKYFVKDSATNLPRLVTDTVYTYPKAPLMYLNGYGNFVSLYDTARNAISVTGSATYDNTTGVINVTGGGSTYFALSSGSVATFAANPSPAIPGLDSGITVKVLFTAAAQANPTLNVNGTGAILIKKYSGSALSSLASGDINSGQLCTFVYDGSYWQMQNPIAPSPAYLANAQVWTGSNNFTAAGGYVYIQGIFATNQTVANANLYIPNGNGLSSAGTASYQKENGVNQYTRVILGGALTPSLTTGNDFSNVLFTHGTFSSATGNSFPLGSTVMFLTPSLTGAGTVENFQTIYGGDRPSFGVRNWGANIGRTRIRGSLHVSKIDSTLNPALLLDLVSNTQGSRPFPLMTAAQKSAITNGWTASITAGGSGYTNGTYNVYLTGGTGAGAEAKVVVSGNTVTSVTVIEYGEGYLAADVLSATITGGSGFTYTISATTPPPIGTHIYQTDGTEGVYVYKSTGWTFAY